MGRSQGGVGECQNLWKDLLDISNPRVMDSAFRNQHENEFIQAFDQEYNHLGTLNSEPGPCLDCPAVGHRASMQLKRLSFHFLILTDFHFIWNRKRSSTCWSIPQTPSWNWGPEIQPRSMWMARTNYQLPPSVHKQEIGISSGAGPQIQALIGDAGPAS